MNIEFWYGISNRNLHSFRDQSGVGCGGAMEIFGRDALILIKGIVIVDCPFGGGVTGECCGIV